MHAGRKWSLLAVLQWTRREIFAFILIATIPTVLFEVFEMEWITIPWLPVALIGTAEAFLIGFKNNASYDRLWEARKIWGAIVNSSRTWGIMSLDFVTNKHAENPVSEQELKKIHTRLIYRHIAWMAALRHQLRQGKPWESMERKFNKEFKKYFEVPEEKITLEEELKPLLEESEMRDVLSKKNRATQIIAHQSRDLRELLEKGYIEDFRHMEMESLLATLYDHQGKSERIKNFPYPRQFATVNAYFVWLFILLVPVGMIPEFDKLGGQFVWLTVPFSVLVCWVFHTMEKIGEATENPFQGGANDVPITNLSRTIEIDLREMLNEDNIPEPTKAINDILM